MKPDAPLLHDDIFTQGVEPKPTQAVEHRQARSPLRRATSRGLRARPRSSIERATRPAGAPGLYRAARLRRLGGRRRAVHDLELDARASSWCAPIAPSCSASNRQDPRDPGRDRRRLRRQDAGLSRAGGAGAVAEDRAAGQDGDEPRGGVPRHRPDLGRRHRGQARRQEGRHASSPPKLVVKYQAGAFPGSPVGAGLHVRLRAVRHPERQDRRLRRRVEPAEGRGLPRARRADLGVRRRELHRRAGPRSSASTRSSCA